MFQPKAPPSATPCATSVRPEVLESRYMKIAVMQDGSALAKTSPSAPAREMETKGTLAQHSPGSVCTRVVWESKSRSEPGKSNGSKSCRTKVCTPRWPTNIDKSGLHCGWYPCSVEGDRGAEVDQKGPEKMEQTRHGRS